MDEKTITGKKAEEFMLLARKRFKRAVDGEKLDRAAALIDREMRYGKQWPEWAEQKRKAEERPMLTFNYLASLLRQTTGNIRLNKLRMKALAANNATQEDADLDNAFFEHVEYNSNADLAYDWAIEQAAACGFPGYFRVLHEYSTHSRFEQDIKIKRIKDAFCVYGDPNFKELDASDRSFYFITEKVLKEDFEKEYPGKATSSTFADMDDNETWFEGDHVVKAEYWYREPVKIEYGITEGGQEFIVADHPELVAVKKRTVKEYEVYQCIISGSDILETPKKYPCTIIPIFPVFGEELLTKDGVVHKSAIRDSIGAQQLYNFHKTNIAETLALQPKPKWVGTVKQFEGRPEFDNANQNNYSKLAYNPDPQAPPPSFQQFSANPMGEIEAASAALQDMEELMSVHKASRGQASNETSGKAINARKTGDDVANYYIVDNAKRAVELCARVIKEMRPKIFDSARTLTSTNEDGSIKTVMPINQYVIKEPDKTGNSQYKPADENHPNSFMMDATKPTSTAVYVEAAPASTTQRMEAAEAMTNMMTAGGAEGLIIWPEVIRAQEFPNSGEMSNIVKNSLIKRGLRDPDPDESGQVPPQPNPQADAAMAQMQAEQQKQQAEMSLKAEELDIKREELRIKDKEADIKLQDSIFRHEEAMMLQPNEEALQQMIMQTVASMLQPSQPMEEPTMQPEAMPMDPMMGGIPPEMPMGETPPEWDGY